MIAPHSITVLIAEDEPVPRRRLARLLGEEPDVRVVAQCAGGREAVTRIAEERPDLVFLDVQMPDLNGFQVIDAVGADRMPTIVFVTAYDEYALKAFEAHALDYVMKPVNRARFHDAVARAKRRVRSERGGELREPLAQLMEYLGGQKYLDRLAVRSDGRIVFLKTEYIDWIEAADDHVKLHVGTKTYLHRDTLGRLEQRLSPTTFLRIHRSTIVNIERIRELQPWFQGDYVLILADGTRLTSGRSYRDRVRALVEQSR